jgi:cobalt-precorrin 5A hydrolase
VALTTRRWIAAGVGCRAHCAPGDLVGALAAALERGGGDIADVRAIYAPDFKREDETLSLFAEHLQKALVFLPLADLERQAHLALTSSAKIAARYGLPSIAETAALAGAFSCVPGGTIRLLGPRTIRGGATCALAAPER